MTLESGKASVQLPETGDAFRDLGATLGDQPWQLTGRVRTVTRMAPRGDARRIVERQIEPP